jgi:hypothetical protein
MPAFTMRDNSNNPNRGANGGHGVGGLTADAAGDLFGTSAPGGANGDGTVFDIPSIDGSDAGTLASFDKTDGAYPDAGLIVGTGDLSVAILRTISTILRCRKVIHSEGMSFTGSVRIHISACADLRFWPIASLAAVQQSPAAIGPLRRASDFNMAAQW